MEPRRSIELRDPRALRALAHPRRIDLLGLLRREGPQTATQAAKRLGESSASSSYHLRQLARYGLVEEVRTGQGRERPWRATALHTSWPSMAPTPELAAASEELERLVARRQFESLVRWIAGRRSEPEAWQQAAAFGDTVLHLTVNELAELRVALERLAEPYLDRLAEPGARPPGARQVVFLQLAFPQLDE